MTRTLVLLALIIAFLSPASAQTRNLATNGRWTTYTGIGSNGKRMCGIATGIIGERSLNVKYFENSSYLLVHIFRSSWSIPPQTQVRTLMTVDSHSGWQVVAIGEKTLLEFAILNEKISEFFNLFGSGVVLRLRFPDGNEPDWSFSLAGSALTTTAIAQCILGLSPAVSTQPFARSEQSNNVTKPFGPVERTPPSFWSEPVPDATPTYRR